MSDDEKVGEFLERLKAAGGVITFRMLGQTWRAEHVGDFEMPEGPILFAFGSDDAGRLGDVAGGLEPDNGT